MEASQLVDYQISATLLCLFEMRSELFGDKFSEGVYFPLEFRLHGQQPHKFLDVCKYIQLFYRQQLMNWRWGGKEISVEKGKIRSEFRLLKHLNSWRD